jgi:hypothetical protein
MNVFQAMQARGNDSCVEAESRIVLLTDGKYPVSSNIRQKCEAIPATGRGGP